MEAGLFPYLSQLFLRIAAVMAKNFIQRAEDPRAAWNEHDGTTTILKYAANIIQSSQVIRQVFNHVQTNDSVKFLFWWVRFAFFPVCVSHPHVRAVQADVLEKGQIKWIDVGGPIQAAWNQLYR